MVPAAAERDGDVRFDRGRRVALLEEDQQALLDHGVRPVGEQGERGVPEVVQDVVVGGALRHVAAFKGIPVVVIGDRGQGPPQGFGVDRRQRRGVPSARLAGACGDVLHDGNLP